jgi:hypothetical protein
MRPVCLGQAVDLPLPVSKVQCVHGSTTAPGRAPLATHAAQRVEPRLVELIALPDLMGCGAMLAAGRSPGTGCGRGGCARTCSPTGRQEPGVVPTVARMLAMKRLCSAGSCVANVRRTARTESSSAVCVSGRIRLQQRPFRLKERGFARRGIEDACHRKRRIVLAF